MQFTTTTRGSNKSRFSQIESSSDSDEENVEKIKEAQIIGKKPISEKHNENERKPKFY